MKLHPLIETLQSLPGDYWKELEKYIHCPANYHDDNISGVLNLFKVTKKFPLNELPDHSTLFQYIYEGELYDKGKLDRLFSYLHQIVRSFIIDTFGEFQKNPFYRQLSLIEYYNYKIPNRVENLLIKLKSDLPPDQSHSLITLHQKFLIDKQLFNYQATQKRSGDLNINSTIESLNVFYKIQRLSLTLGLLIHNLNTQLDISPHIQFIESEYENLITQNNESSPVIKLFILGCLQLCNHPKKNIEELYILNEKYGNTLNINDRRVLAYLIRNHFQQIYNFDDKTILPKLWEIYKSHLENGYLFEVNSTIPIHTYRNIIRYGIKMNEFEWVGKFLDDYTAEHIVGTLYKQEVHNINKAFWLFHQGYFDQAYELIQYKFEDPVHKIDARRLELMINYEQNYSEMDTRIDAFRKLIQRDVDLQAYMKTSNENFIKFLKRIYENSGLPDPGKIQTIIQQIHDTKLFIEEDWLLKKAQELLPKS